MKTIALFIVLMLAACASNHTPDSSEIYAHGKAQEILHKNADSVTWQGWIKTEKSIKKKKDEEAYQKKCVDAKLSFDNAMNLLQVVWGNRLLYNDNGILTDNINGALVAAQNCWMSCDQSTNAYLSDDREYFAIKCYEGYKDIKDLSNFLQTGE
jgi:hypothetical protein